MDNLYIGDQFSSDPSTLFNQAINLQNRITSAKSRLQLRNDFEVIDGLTVFRTPESAGLLKSIVVGMMIGVGIAYLIILLKGINAYLSRVEAERFADR